MINKALRFAVGLLAFAVIGTAGFMGLHTADAQSGGGYPSRPNFQALGIAQTAPTGHVVASFASTAGTAPISSDAGEIFNIRNLSTTGGDTRLLAFGQNAGNAFVRSVLLGAGPSSAPLQLGPSAAPLTVSGVGGVFTQGATGGDKGAGTVNATGFFINGNTSPRVVSGTFNPSPSTCPAFNATAVGITCTYTSAGNYAVNVTSAFTTIPACTVTAWLIPFAAFVHSSPAPSVSTINIGLFNTSTSAQADQVFSIVCVGT